MTPAAQAVLIFYTIVIGLALASIIAVALHDFITNRKNR